MMPSRFRSLTLAVLAISLAGCATVSRGIETGSDRAGRTLAHIGNRIEEGTHTAERKTRSLWQRLFGDRSNSKKQKPRPIVRDSDPPAPPPKPATFDTYTEEKIGS